MEKEKKSLEQKETSELVFLAYSKGLSEAAARVLIKKHGIASAVKPANTISQHLFRFTDKKDTNKSVDTIFKIDCMNFPMSYIGEIARLLYVQFKDHRVQTSNITQRRAGTSNQRKDSTDTDYKSALIEHALPETLG